jgi:hypothetical protein
MTTEPQAAEVSALIALMLFGVALLPWVTYAIAEILLLAYRRAVVKSMGAARAAAPQAAGAVAFDGLADGVELVAQSAETEALNVTAHRGDGLIARFRRATKTATAVYGVAGLAYAILMAVAMAVRTDLHSAGSYFFLTVAYSWPVVMTTIIIGAPRRRWQMAIVLGYVVVFMTGGSVLPGMDVLFPIFMANLGATMVALVVRARRIRAVAPLVAAVLTIVGAAFVFLVGIAAAWGPEETTGENFPAPFLFFLILMTLLAAGPVASWLALRWIGTRYARKRTSDQALAMASVWLIFAGIQSTTFAYTDARWMLPGLIAFVVFLALASAGFAVARRRRTDGGSPAAARSAEVGPRLLVLRVFALGRRSRRLFDSVAARWRHIGSVQLIAGPDLARSTVEPHEFLDFLGRRLAGRFLASPEAVDAALSALDIEPDYDGRFRTTDFFCRDHTWRAVFGQLAAGSHVVLMDLRGFTTANAGCTYEVSELLNVVPLERIVLVVDKSTDERFLEGTLEDAWRRRAVSSPNRDTPVGRVRIFRESERGELNPDKLLRILCDAAAQPAREAVARAS